MMSMAVRAFCGGRSDTRHHVNRPQFVRSMLVRRLGVLMLGTALTTVMMGTAYGREPRRSGASVRSVDSSIPTLSLMDVDLSALHPARTLTVTTAMDVVDPGDGELSLREAVNEANATSALDTINFLPALESQTLVLAGGQLTVEHDLIIEGDRNDDSIMVTMDGNEASRILRIIGAETDVALRNLTLTKGRQGGEGEDGGAIEHIGRSLTVDGCTVRGNSVYIGNDEYFGGTGGGSTSRSLLTVANSTIADNDGAFGGGIGGGGRIVVRNSVLENNTAQFGGAIDISHGSLTVEQSVVSDNHTFGYSGQDGGGALALYASVATIARSTVNDNHGGYFSNAGISEQNSQVSIFDSTISRNTVDYYGYVAGINGSGGRIVLRNSTITGNVGKTFGGIQLSYSVLDIANSIVAGNFSSDDTPSDVVGTGSGTSIVSNGHNIFGSDVDGSIAGDREKVAPRAIFAAIDPETGGGKLSASGIVPLKNSLANPALSGADPLAAGAFDQLGTTRRPQPSGSLPDIGAVEMRQPLSTGATANNDVITGSDAVNHLVGLQGNDLIRALGGNDMIDAGAGSDVIDGGPGNDVINGGTGVDLAAYPGPAGVNVDLAAGNANRGGETDTLISIEGAIGSAKADRFLGSPSANWFQGGLGRDIAAGGAGRDTYDFDTVQQSPPGPSFRDTIVDFAPGQDVIDLSGIDADATRPGDQAFQFIGRAALTAVPGTLAYALLGGNTILRGNVDADPAPELELQLNGNKSLTERDLHR